jgi:hypothetical protein
MVIRLFQMAVTFQKPACSPVMPIAKQCLIACALISSLLPSWLNVLGQASPTTPSTPVQLVTEPVTPVISNPTASVVAPASQLLLDFKPSDIKFSLQSLMAILRDPQHEGWVLAAYPDPKTSRPLIGAGFSLDVAATDHPQTDPLNPHPFVEPSSAQLWQAAGLDADQLQTILNRFDRDLEAWKKKKYRRKIKTHSLRPEITEVEATTLLRISSIQAVQNARAYCRNFDQLTGPQQMALSQLVFQMGVNLEEFVQFLGAINGDATQADPSQPTGGTETADDHWKTVQRTLIESQWAHRYTSRATTVIAMFDPDYLQDPHAAVRRVEAELPPPVKHHHKKARSSQTKRKVA